MRKTVLIVTTLFCAATLAWADNYNVGTDGDLREAIKNNNANITVTSNIDLSNSTLSIPKGNTGRDVSVP